MQLTDSIIVDLVGDYELASKAIFKVLTFPPIEHSPLKQQLSDSESLASPPAGAVQ